MAARISSTHPIDTLRSQSKRLEDVLALCLAKPTPAAVHRLRTTIRRVEAQTKLLTQLRGLPPHHSESRTLLKRLKKLRRLAGKVRDLDVQLGCRSTGVPAGQQRKVDDGSTVAIEQGYEMKRPSILHVKVHGEEVQPSGRCVTVIDGRVRIE